MTVSFIPGYNPDTDMVETDQGNFAFTSRSTMVRITRGVPLDGVIVSAPHGALRMIMSNTALVKPLPEEFLWRPVKLLGVVGAWWSLCRGARSDMMTTHYQVGIYHHHQEIPYDLIRDEQAWRAFCDHQFRNFLWAYQEACDAQPAPLLANPREPSADEVASFRTAMERGAL